MATKRKAARKSKPAKTRKTAAKRSYRSVMADTAMPVGQRVAAIQESSAAVCENEADFQAMLKVLRNRDEPIKVRLAALQSLQAASFSVIAFESCRADYTAALREVAEDPDPELRQRALGLLARRKDGFAQKKLLEGLKSPAKALVSPEKALQLLSYDVHTGAYAAARTVLKKPPNDDARREALRLLAADAKSAPLFAKLLRDKKELREIRQISASALQTLEPKKFQQHARKILLDKSDYDDIKATSLVALEQFGDNEALGKDKALLQSVNRFKSGKTSAKYKQTARRFLSKYSP